MHKYEYDGPVLEFQKVLAYRWHGITYAMNPEKAKSNLTFQFKKEHKRFANQKVTLPGDLTIVL